MAMLDVNMTVVWLVILVILIVIELITMGLTTIWFTTRFGIIWKNKMQAGVSS